jgi:5-formyltetrahydrofolate cyclo-ligase
MVGPPLASPDALAALRRRMRSVRQALDKEQIWHPAPLDARLVEIIGRSEVIGLYAPMSGEPDPALILTGHPKLTSRPALKADGSMVFRLWRTGDPEVTSSWGGTQPADDAKSVQPDVIFIPLVAFDSDLNRLGQGGGHYDRYLAGHSRALRIGVAWDEQQVPTLPVRPWDMPLDAVITEQHCYMKELRCLTD